MPPSTSEIIWSVIIGGVGLTISLGYLLLHFGVRRLLPTPAYEKDTATLQDLRRRGDRRVLGMAVLGLVSVGLFLGVNLIDPLSFPVEFALYWLLILLMVLWLLALALADIRQTLIIHRRWLKQRMEDSRRRWLVSARAEEQEDHR